MNFRILILLFCASILAVNSFPIGKDNESEENESSLETTTEAENGETESQEETLEDQLNEIEEESSRRKKEECIVQRELKKKLKLIMEYIIERRDMLNIFHIQIILLKRKEVQIIIESKDQKDIHMKREVLILQMDIFSQKMIITGIRIEIQMIIMVT
uniref:Uncharacterized protein n=1 Tax=Caenorhabditis tropicalis TaxID=1561998 RepID=A0A1I7SYR5_9PELO